MPEKQRPLNYFLVVLAKQNQQYCVVGFSKTINPLELAGYEMIIANSAPFGYVSSHIQCTLME